MQEQYPGNTPVISSEGGFLFLTLREHDRLSISTSIERLINMLDELEPDPDLEDGGDQEASDLAGAFTDRELDDSDLEDGADGEASLGWGGGSQAVLHSTNISTDEREDVSEDEGADIQSQPHDAEDQGDAEPFLGWSERCSLQGQGVEGWTDIDTCEASVIHGPLGFRGDGYLAGRTMLREFQQRRPDVPQSHVNVSPALGWQDEGRIA